jgi:large subunit GTPase 1
MVGYPNVGKSSVINSLLNKKKVGVASQPGKTKHYQTLYLTKDIVLVDCPGLVFPNVAATIAEMVLNGVIPIDNLREIYSPMTLLVQRIPRSMIEEKYGVRFKEGIYNAETLLQGYANLKGLHTGSGLPNESQAARVVLKDYTTGHLTHCKYPPGIQPKVNE